MSPAKISRVMRATSIACLISLSACGGGGADVASSSAPAMGLVQPAYQRLADPIEAPSLIDENGTGSSAYLPPAKIYLDANRVGLTRTGVGQDEISRSKNMLAGASSSSMPAIPVVYTPAQIRAAYNLSPVESTSNEDLGAGQTIYIINAYHHPNMLADLNAFNARFGLPLCTEEVIPLTATKLPPVDKTQCKISTIFTDTNGSPTAVTPQYVTGWAYEIALDTQWAHAIAPLARLVLIEAESSDVPVMSRAVSLANSLGIGAVSMSFVAGEGSWVQDPAYSTTVFESPRMTYFAASGDNGMGVNWPSVIPSVVAVGGTTLAYDGVTRTETIWGGTGGGISQYIGKPFYQNTLQINGVGVTGRSAADVSMIADPSSGAYSVFTAPGKDPFWYSAGGTSLGTPIWAGISAIINAKRMSQSPLKSAFHKLLYQFSYSATTYPTMMYDINVGSNGTCQFCQAGTYYDAPSGLGSPIAGKLIEYFRRMP